MVTFVSLPAGICSKQHESSSRLRHEQRGYTSVGHKFCTQSNSAGSCEIIFYGQLYFIFTCICKSLRLPYVNKYLNLICYCFCTLLICSANENLSKSGFYKSLFKATLRQTLIRLTYDELQKSKLRVFRKRMFKCYFLFFFTLVAAT